MTETTRRKRTAALLATATVVTGGALLVTLLVRGGAAPSPDHAAGPKAYTVRAPRLDGRSDLRSVACTSRLRCIAVGSSTSAGLPAALVESWDGTAWSVAHSAGRGVDSWLNSVACPTPQWCVAVGGDSPTGDSDNPLDQTLVEVLTAGRWALLPSPTPGNGDQSDLQSVACTAPSFCMAVGSFSPVSNPYDPEVKPLVEVWDGRGWTVLPSGSTALGRQSVLRSVACTTPSWCTAVGSSTSIDVIGDPAGHPLVEQWDGTSWRAVPTPGAGLGRQSMLESVSCWSTSSCLAVGSSSAGGDAHTPNDRTLVERWDGSAWSIVRSPNHGAAPSSLHAVSCTSAVTCLAVGSYSTGAALENNHGLVETWNGRALSTALATDANSDLAAVACVPRQSCTVVGRAVTTGSLSSQWQTFIEVVSVSGRNTSCLMVCAKLHPCSGR